jgi:hypothetical protein
LKWPTQPEPSPSPAGQQKVAKRLGFLQKKMASKNVQAVTGSHGPPRAPKNKKKQVFSMFFNDLPRNIKKIQCFFMLLESAASRQPPIASRQPPATFWTLGTILTTESCNIPKHTFPSTRNTNF